MTHGLGPVGVDIAGTTLTDAERDRLRHPLAGNHDHRGQYSLLRDALLRGYAAESTPPSNLERQVSVLVTARLFLTLGWILDDWPTVDHRPWGPGFVRGSQLALREWLVAPEVG